MEPKTSTRGPSASARFAISFVFGIVLGAVIVLGRAHGDLDKTAFGDGLLVRSVAARIGAAPQDVNSVVVSRGTSLRYGRIGMPAAAWLLAGGKPHEVRLRIRSSSSLQRASPLRRQLRSSRSQVRSPQCSHSLRRDFLLRWPVDMER